MPSANINPQSEVALQRYYRNKTLGEDIPTIAAAENVKEDTVRQSIRSVELFRARHSIENIQEATVGVLLEVAPKVKKSLDRALNAKTVIEDSKGRKTKVDDLSMQMVGVDKYRGLLQTVQPRTPANAIQINNANVGERSNRQASASYVGMEDMLTEIMKEQEARPAPESRQLKGAVLESVRGEYEEAEPAVDSDE